MSTDKQDDDRIEVKEELDGSAVVALPDTIPNPQADEGEEEEAQPEVAAAEGGAAGDDPDNEDHPDDSEALRAAKRARRKAKRELVKRTNVEKDHKLALLERQNQELLERLSAVERKTHSADLARIDKAIEDMNVRLQYAKAKIAEATNAGDGEALAKAQELWYEARQQVDTLNNLKKTAVQPQRQQNIPDPRLQRLAADWMDRNRWYKPDNKDMDSRIAKQIDEALTAEGWDPMNREYWEELDNRLQQYLPHRYNRNTDEYPSARSKPRSIVTGSGRESSTRAGGANTFTLTAEQVRAMKDAGFWDDPDKRNKMIKRYAIEARKTQGYRS
jgi:hypothetical protein